MFVLKPALILYGFLIWLAATVVLRIGGRYPLHPNHRIGVLVLFTVSFPLMALLARRLCRRLPAQEWPTGAISLALPTLLLDPFSSAFFPAVFPNMAPELAGVFGGWMLWCCAGALVGVSIYPGNRS
jgi:Family of unknown function (DUF5367)